MTDETKALLRDLVQTEIEEAEDELRIAPAYVSEQWRARCEMRIRKLRVALAELEQV